MRLCLPHSGLDLAIMRKAWNLGRSRSNFKMAALVVSKELIKVGYALRRSSVFFRITSPRDANSVHSSIRCPSSFTKFEVGLGTGGQ